MQTFQYLLTLLTVSLILSNCQMLLKENRISNSITLNKNNNKLNNKIDDDNILYNVIQKARIEAVRGGLAGGLAGCIQVITLMWLRTTVNYQYRYGVNTITAITELYKQGGIPRFYRGLLFALLQGPLARFGTIAANEGAKVLTSYYMKDLKANLIISTSVGSILAAIWRIVLMPLDTFKTILQVEGSIGFQKLIHRLSVGDVGILYQGTFATILVTITSYYPWFFVHNYLDSWISYSKRNWLNYVRSALIGFFSSAVSDTISNFIRVIKTVKQSNISEIGVSVTYSEIIIQIYKEGGIMAFLGRGLLTRILTNGLQSMLFTVLWKIFANRNKNEKDSTKNDEKENVYKIV